MDTVTTFSTPEEGARAVALLDRLGVEYRLISPAPAYARVGVPALVVSAPARSAVLEGGGHDIVTAGWVEYREPAGCVPGDTPREFAEDVLGRVAVVVLAACIADPSRLRLIAHFAGDAAEVLPYLNTELPQGSYVPASPVFTYMDGRRMVSLFRDRVAIAKVDDIVDVWASLERVRCLVGDVWARRSEVTPSFQTRRRPPALEIYRRLPQTNCGECGEAGCTAFAWAVWRGDADPRLCGPVFGGDRGDLRDALVAVCAGLGVVAPDADD